MAFSNDLYEINDIVLFCCSVPFPPFNIIYLYNFQTCYKCCSDASCNSFIPGIDVTGIDFTGSGATNPSGVSLSLALVFAIATNLAQHQHSGLNHV